MPPPMSYKSYSEHVNGLNISASVVAEKTATGAASDLHISAGRQPESATSTDPPLSCSVSVDGSWQRRGYSSLNGIVTALSLPDDVETPGKVLDVAVPTKNCKQCRIYEELPHNPVQYLTWKITHVCKTNHQGSAGSMETEGAKLIFSRSIAKHKLVYENHLGDGDGKGHSYVAGCYGPDIEVKKLQRVGHVQEGGEKTEIFEKGRA